jgi:hypothetical protein
MTMSEQEPVDPEIQAVADYIGLHSRFEGKCTITGPGYTEPPYPDAEVVVPPPEDKP